MTLSATGAQGPWPILFEVVITDHVEQNVLSKLIEKQTNLCQIPPPLSERVNNQMDGTNKQMEHLLKGIA